MRSYVVERYNYEAQFEGIEAQVVEDLRAALMSGRYILSQEVAGFESAFASYVGSSHAIGVNSGTDALILSCEALGIGAGDEVITVANTFHATALAIARTGAKPVLVDCDDRDYLVNLELLERAVTPRTKALMIVHLFGKAVDMDAVSRIAGKHGLLVIEDVSQATGAKWAGKRLGSTSTLGCFSLHPSKNLAAAGDAGIITTNDAKIAERLRGLRHFGQAVQNVHRFLAHNSRLDTLQAIVLHHKLRFLDTWNAARIRHARRYRELLDGLPITAPGPSADPAGHVYHLFQVRVNQRDRLLEHLQGKGVDAVVRYPTPIHLQEPFAHLGYARGDFPAAERQALETLCLPMRPDISERELQYTCDAVAGFLRTAA